MIDYNDIGARHFNWVERMGWHNKTVLESLALIASEVGEAADESFTTPPSQNLGSELADIILRTVDLAKTTEVDLNAVMQSAEIKHCGSSLFESYAHLMVDFGKWVNTARYEVLGPDFGVAMGKIVKRVESIANTHGFDLEAEINSKLQVNELRGKRGRKI